MSDLRCPEAADSPCNLSGANLFLIDSIAASDRFTGSGEGADGFLGNSIDVPRPAGDQIYLKLRDDPAVINPVSLGVRRDPPAPESANSVPKG
ncbi:MAG: hypothetical protein U1F35_13295 [Steroidobacteraceae bacterium]